MLSVSRCCWHSFVLLDLARHERTHALLRMVHWRTKGKGNTTLGCVPYLASVFHLLSSLSVCQQPNENASG